MDTTARDFLCSGLPFMAFMDVVLRHPLFVAAVQLAIAAGVAWFVTERWQRWRQRRDFQHEAMRGLAGSSAEALRVLYELMAARGERREELKREYPTKLAPLLALDADFFASFDDERLLKDFYYLSGVMNAAFETVSAPDTMAEAQARATLKCVTAQRRLMIAKMSQEMGLPRGSAALLYDLEQRAKALPPGVSVAAVPEAS